MKKIILEITEGELALLEMAIADMEHINNESNRKAPTDDPSRKAGRARVVKATAQLKKKLARAN